MNNPRHRILLADDDDLVLDMLEATLAGAYDVRGVTSGDEALRVAGEWLPELVVLDVAMPGMDGYQTCQRLRERPGGADLAVLFHSGHTGLDERLKGYSVGGDDYLPKPFDPAELLAKISRLLALRTQRERERTEAETQLSDLTSTVLASADMVGEAGVVLDAQRDLMACHDAEAVARVVAHAVARYRFESCVRVQVGHEVVARGASDAPCSALEISLLEHLNGLQGGANIRAFAAHTGFRYGAVSIFVRGLPMHRDASMDRELSDRMGRVIDNVALLCEGALCRVLALEATLSNRMLLDTQALMRITRETLADISARGHSQRLQTENVFTRLASQVEAAFMQLGLTSQQEEYLSHLVRQHREMAMHVLEDGDEVHRNLNHVIDTLARHD